MRAPKRCARLTRAWPSTSPGRRPRSATRTASGTARPCAAAISSWSWTRTRSSGSRRSITRGSRRRSRRPPAAPSRPRRCRSTRSRSPTEAPHSPSTSTARPIAARVSDSNVPQGGRRSAARPESVAAARTTARACRPTANGKRSSTTTTSPSVRPGGSSVTRSAPTARKATPTNCRRSRGRPTRRSSPRTACKPGYGAWSTTSSRRRPTSCSRSTRRRIYAKPGDVARSRAAGALRRRSQQADRRSTTRCSRSRTTCRELVWRKDSRAFTFEYNQRGHQVYRVIEVDAHDRRTRAR